MGIYISDNVGNLTKYAGGGQPLFSLDKIYPIGSIYMNVNSTNPKNLFGGEWVRIAQGRTLIGEGTITANNTENDGSVTAGEFIAYGGKAGGKVYQHQLLKHSHRIWSTNMWSSNAVGLGHENKAYGVAGVDQSSGKEDYYYTESGDGHQIIEDAGVEKPKIIPPYLVVYIWQRTA